MIALFNRAVFKASLILVVLFCLGASSSIIVDYAIAQKFGNDFGVYWRAANQPVGEVYFWPGRFPFPYAPTMLLWIQPLSIIPKWPAYFLFTGASVLAFIWAVHRHIPKLAIALCLISPPFLRGIFTGQVSAAVAALLIWACGSERRIAAGIAFGVIASIKPHLVIMAPLMLALNRDWRAFIAAGASFVSIVLVSLIVFGTHRWPEWIASMDHFHRAVAGTGVINVGATPAMLAERYGYSPIAFMMMGTLAGAAIVWRCRSSDPLEKASAIAAGSILAAPYALVYDLTAVLPFLALAALRGRALAAFAIALPIHPLPVILAGVELIRSAKNRSARLRNSDAGSQGEDGTVDRSDFLPAASPGARLAR